MENVVAQWAELLLQKPQVGGSNHGSSNVNCMEKTEIKEKEGVNGPIFQY